MIGDGAFEAGLNTVERLLAKLKLLDERQKTPNKNLKAADFRGKSYRDGYNLAIRELAYDFRLVDQALMLFTKDGSDLDKGSLSFSYAESPLAVISYTDFVALEEEVQPDDPNYENALAYWGDELRQEYEIYVNTLELREGFTPLRYDCKAEHYRSNAHPASHVHFGFLNDIRVATRRIMNPVSFTIFVLRQRYPAKWAEVIRWTDCSELCNEVRRNLEPVHSKYWCAHDERELYLF
jgi:hypothetical protein